MNSIGKRTAQMRVCRAPRRRRGCRQQWSASCRREASPTASRSRACSSSCSDSHSSQSGDVRRRCCNIRADAAACAVCPRVPPIAVSPRTDAGRRHVQISCEFQPACLAIYGTRTCAQPEDHSSATRTTQPFFGPAWSLRTLKKRSYLSNTLSCVVATLVLHLQYGGSTIMADCSLAASKSDSCSQKVRLLHGDAWQTLWLAVGNMPGVQSSSGNLCSCIGLRQLKCWELFEIAPRRIAARRCQLSGASSSQL